MVSSPALMIPERVGIQFPRSFLCVEDKTTERARDRREVSCRIGLSEGF